MKTIILLCFAQKIDANLLIVPPIILVILFIHYIMFLLLGDNPSNKRRIIYKQGNYYVQVKFIFWMHECTCYTLKEAKDYVKEITQKTEIVA